MPGQTAARSEPGLSVTADLLRAHGAVDDLPQLDRIQISRGNDRYTSFLRSTNDWNRFTLLDLLAREYCLVSGELQGLINSRVYVTVEEFWDRNRCRFPDLGHVIIHRPQPDGKTFKTIRVDVAAMLAAGDCSKDVVLQWGDRVEVPETDHPVNAKWSGPEAAEIQSLIKCISRRVALSIKGAPTTLQLAPECFPSGGINLNVKPVSFALRSVLDNSARLRASSDLSRVKVTRREPGSGPSRQWVLDCSGNNAPDFQVRDGDVIEVPEK